MKKVGIKYLAFVEEESFPYKCLLFDEETVQKCISQKHILACITYNDGKCFLYYNEDGCPKEELQKAGYSIVTKFQKVEIYEKISEFSL